jgi:Protein of unknown function (DUF2924)
MILDQGVAWNGETYGSLSQVAKAMTGTSWNGIASSACERPGPTDPGWSLAGQGIATPLRPAPPQYRSRMVEPLWPDILAGRRPRHEIGEKQNDTALRRLHPRLVRAWFGAGVQLARQLKGGIGSLRQEPSS